MFQLSISNHNGAREFAKLALKTMTAVANKAKKSKKNESDSREMFIKRKKLSSLNTRLLCYSHFWIKTKLELP